MEQAVVVEGGILTGEKIKIKNKSPSTSPIKSIKNKTEGVTNSSESTNQENTEISNVKQQAVAVKRRHSAGKINFI